MEHIAEKEHFFEKSASLKLENILLHIARRSIQSKSIPTQLINSVKYMKDGDDEIAYVTSSYFVKEGNSYERTYQEYVLRQDANKDWKILAYYQIEGKSEEDD